MRSLTKQGAKRSEIKSTASVLTEEELNVSVMKQDQNAKRLYKRSLILIGQHKTYTHFHSKHLSQATDRQTIKYTNKT